MREVGCGLLDIATMDIVDVEDLMVLIALRRFQSLKPPLCWRVAQAVGYPHGFTSNGSMQRQVKVSKANTIRVRGRGGERIEIT